MAPSGSPTTCPSYDYEFVNSSTIVDHPNDVASLYNAAVMNKPIIFNDAQGSEICNAAKCVAKGNDSTCSIRSVSVITSISNPPIIYKFKQKVKQKVQKEVKQGEGEGICCDAKSCVFSYVDTESLCAVAGERISFSYRANGSSRINLGWYEVAIVLYDTDEKIKQVKVVRGLEFKKSTDFFDIEADGDYFVRFFAASYDYTNDGKLGSKVQINSFSKGSTPTWPYTKPRTTVPIAQPTPKPPP